MQRMHECHRLGASGQKAPKGEGMSVNLEAKLNEAERKAHDALSRYKFVMFGYWAAVWTHINDIGEFKRPNPFREYVALARQKAPSKRGTTPKIKIERR